MHHLKKFLFCCALFILATAATFTQEAKNALLIANGDYARDMGALSQPIPEARELKSALESIGFDVTLIENADLKMMQKELKAFGRKTEKEGGIAFFHYGRHAVQINGVNHLIPLKASLEDEEAAADNCLNVENLVDKMKGDANIAIFDCSRNNLFPNNSNRSGVSALGQAASKPQPINSIIVYSASDGHTAQSGVFTPILTKYITEKNKSFSDILKQVMKEVDIKTDGKQNPAAYSRLLNLIYVAGF
jgi:uncharacterized protein containing caspase domain-protein